jgi:hypothetical protein
VLDASGATTYLRGEDERNSRPRRDVSFAFPRGPARLAGHGWPEPHSCLLDAAFDIVNERSSGKIERPNDVVSLAAECIR